MLPEALGGVAGKLRLGAAATKAGMPDDDGAEEGLDRILSTEKERALLPPSAAAIFGLFRGSKLQFSPFN